MNLKINGVTEEIKNCIGHLNSTDQITEAACKAWSAEYHWWIDMFSYFTDLF
ncbi:hypothetical protein [Neobacillus sp. NPDC093127]|uniref:hypothetical protein n=1 Tax=Neobacillus sp. NPDC093127 TaxID=3364296 RepID=UPI00381CE7C2